MFDADCRLWTGDLRGLGLFCDIVDDFFGFIARVPAPVDIDEGGGQRGPEPLGDAPCRTAEVYLSETWPLSRSLQSFVK